jgi:hypothetical protein
MLGRTCVVVIVLLGSAMAACSSNSRGHAEPSGTSTSAPSPEVSRVAVAATPVVSGNTYTFSEKGYSIGVPEGWTMTPNYFNDPASGRFPVDAIFPKAEAPAGEASTVVTIECLKPVSGQATTADFRDARAALLQQLGKNVAPPRPVRVGVDDGFAIDYTQEIATAGAPLVLDKTDVVVLTDGCRWVVTLSAPAGQRESRSEGFASMLRSITFTPPQ